MVMPEVHGRRDDREGPPTYRDPSFSELIANAGRLTSTGPSLRVGDFMSRHGKLADELRAIAPQHEYTAIALTGGQLSRTPEGIITVNADARDLTAANLAPFDKGFIRYGVKDFREEEQSVVLSSIYKALKGEEEGEEIDLVVADMVAPPELKDWLNEHHRQKQRFEKRNIERDGECHIPTQEEWMTLLRGAGFEPSVEAMYTSHVTTTQWAGKAGQISDAQREEMDGSLLAAPNLAKRVFNIREEDGLVLIDYPVIIIRAKKVSRVVDAPMLDLQSGQGSVVLINNE